MKFTARIADDPENGRFILRLQQKHLNGIGLRPVDERELADKECARPAIGLCFKLKRRLPTRRPTRDFDAADAFATGREIKCQRTKPILAVGGGDLRLIATANPAPTDIIDLCSVARASPRADTKSRHEESRNARRLTTAAAVTAGLPFDPIYATAAWAGWLVPLGVLLYLCRDSLSALRPRERLAPAAALE